MPRCLIFNFVIKSAIIITAIETFKRIVQGKAEKNKVAVCSWAEKNEWVIILLLLKLAYYLEQKKFKW